ncbi:MAG: hypothetical protein MUO26_08010 [Methanotrichaceae archaeon]|nr:hypothetical protein [Methanotrichaceae archaeon]
MPYELQMLLSWRKLSFNQSKLFSCAQCLARLDGKKKMAKQSKEKFIIRQRHRPFVIMLLAILALLGFAQAAVVTLQMLHLLPVWMGPMNFWIFNLWGALMWGIMAFIYLWLFRMLWNVMPQGWLFLVIISGLNLILAILSILGASTWRSMMPAISINGFILFYCLMPQAPRKPLRFRPRIRLAGNILSADLRGTASKCV